MKNSNKIKLISDFLNKAVKVRHIIEQSGVFDNKAVTFLQVRVLEFIKNNSKASVGSLAHELDMSLSSITQLTYRLVTSGLIKREEDFSDHRVILLFLTKKGEKFIKTFTKQMLKSHLKIFDLIPNSDIKEMIRIFTNILSIYKKNK